MISRTVLPKMRKFSVKNIEKIKTHILCPNIFFFSDNRPVHEMMCKFCTVRGATDGYIMRRMLLACWIPKAAHTHSEYVTLLFLGNKCYTYAPHCYVIRTLSVLLNAHVRAH